MHVMIFEESMMNTKINVSLTLSTRAAIHTINIERIIIDYTKSLRGRVTVPGIVSLHVAYKNSLPILLYTKGQPTLLLFHFYNQMNFTFSWNLATSFFASRTTANCITQQVTQQNRWSDKT